MLTQIKITVRKKESCKWTLVLKRVTHIQIFLLVCPTISNNLENGDIFIERTKRPRSTPQPSVTKATSTSLRTQLTNTRNKLSEGKIYFAWNFNYTELAKLIRDSSSLTSLGKNSDDTVTRRSITINQALKNVKDSELV